MYLTFTIKSSFFNETFIECEATFKNYSDMEVKVTQKKLSRAFVKETQ